MKPMVSVVVAAALCFSALASAQQSKEKIETAGDLLPKCIKSQHLDDSGPLKDFGDAMYCIGYVNATVEALQLTGLTYSTGFSTEDAISDFINYTTEYPKDTRSVRASWIIGAALVKSGRAYKSKDVPPAKATRK